ncbi:hypothetical protein FOA52_000370 [Chlamydomonas sp. UWO 241]|nr:hypothetical protein FOA52_000370 [Chlamydomonas sp. UWO 241]
MQPEMLPEMLAAVGAGHIWEASMRVPAGSLSPPLLQLPLAPHVQLQHERPHRRPSAAPTTSKALLRTVEEDLNAEAFATVSGCNNLHAEDFHADAIVSRGGGEVLTSNDDDLIVMGSTESNVIFKLFDEKEDSRPHYEAAGAARGGVLVRSPVQRKRSASMAGESLGSRLGSDGCVMPSSDSTSEPQQGSPGVRGLRKSLPQDIMAGPEDYVSAPHALAHAPHRQLSMAGHSDFVSAPHAHTPRRQLSMAGHEDHASAPHAPAPAPNHQRAWSPGHSTHLQDAAGGHAMMHRSMSYTKADSVTISKITRASGMLPSKLPVGTSATQVSSMAGAAGWGDAADGSSAGTAAVDMPQKRLQSMLFLKHRIMSGSLHTIDDAGSASPVSPNSKSTVAALGRRQSSHFMPIGSQGGSPAVRRVGVGSPGESFSHQHTRPLSALNESNRVKLTGSPAGGTASLAGTGDGSGRAGRHSLSGHSQTMRTSTPATQHLTSSVFSSFGGLAGVGGGSGGGPSSHVATGLPSSSVSAGSCRLPTTAYTSGNGCPPSTSTSAFSARHSTGGETMGLQLPKRDSVQASGAMVVRRDSMQRKDSGHLVGMDPVPGQVVLARETPTSGATFQGPNHRVLTTATSFDMLQCLLERNSSNEGVGGSGGVRLRRIPPHVPSITQLPPQPPAAPAAKPTAGLAASEQQQQPQARRKAAAAAATPRSPATPAPPATPVAPNAPSSSSTPAGPMPMPAQSAPLQQQHGHTGGDASLHGTSHMQLIASAALMSLDRAGSSRGALGGGGDDEARSCELPQEFGSAPSAGSPLARVATHSGPLMTIKPNYQRRPGSYVGGLQGEGSNDEPHYTTLSEVDEYENDYEDEEGGEEDEQQQVVCFHKVTARPALDPETGEPAIVLAQTDVTEQCLTEDALQALARAQLTILSQGFPRHIVEFFSHMGGSESLPSHMGSLARYHRNVSILFMDFVGFTAMSKDVEPHAVLTIVNDLFTRFDDLCDVHGVQKVDTAGDSYIVACGVMTSDADGFNTICSDETVDPVECAHRCMAFATDMLLLCKDMTMPHNGESVQIRVGIHTGDCVSGLVGSRLPKFSLFGDTMNTASRMESTGRPGHVHVSESTWALLGPIPPSKLFVSASAPGAKVGEGTDGDGSDGMDGQHGEVVRPLYTWELTGGVAIKGKGVMQTYLWAPPLLPPHATDAGEHTDTSIEERSGSRSQRD